MLLTCGEELIISCIIQINNLIQIIIDDSLAVEDRKISKEYRDNILYMNKQSIEQLARIIDSSYKNAM